MQWRYTIIKLVNKKELKRGLQCNSTKEEKSNIIRNPSYTKLMEAKNGLCGLANY
jgi:hypothetical protein